MKTSAQPEWNSWLQEWPGSAASDRLETQRRWVAVLLGHIPKPLEELTARDLRLAKDAAGVGATNHAPLAFLRAFIAWCQKQGKLPAAMNVRGYKHPSSGKIKEVAKGQPAEEIVRIVDRWLAKTADRKMFRRAVLSILERTGLQVISSAKLVQAARDSGFSQRYADNALARSEERRVGKECRL